MSDVEDTGFAGMGFKFNEAQRKLLAVLAEPCACGHERASHITALYPCDGACKAKRCFCDRFTAAAKVSP